MSELGDKFDLLTLADAAELLHCSKAHVGKAVNGRVRGCAPIPCVSLGRRRLIRRESLRLWLEANEHIANGTLHAVNDNVRPANDNARVLKDAKLTTLPVRGAGKRG